MDTKNLEWLLGERVYVSETDDLQNQHRKEYYEPVFQQIYGQQYQAPLEAVLLADNPDERLDQLDKALFMAFIHDEFDLSLLTDYVGHLSRDDLGSIRNATEKLVSLMEHYFSLDAGLTIEDIDDALYGGASYAKIISALTDERKKIRKETWEKSRYDPELDLRLSLFKRPKRDLSLSRKKEHKKTISETYSQLIEWYKPIFDIIFDTQDDYVPIIKALAEARPEIITERYHLTYANEEKHITWCNKITYLDKFLLSEFSKKWPDYEMLSEQVKIIVSSTNHKFPFVTVPFSTGGTEIIYDEQHPRVAVMRGTTIPDIKMLLPKGITKHSHRLMNAWCALLDDELLFYPTKVRDNVQQLDVPLYDGDMLTYFYNQATLDKHYHLRSLDQDVMSHIVSLLKMSGFYELAPLADKKYKIYAALASGPSRHEIEELNKLFPDHIPVFVDKFNKRWDSIVQENLYDILKRNVKYGSVDGSDADLLDPSLDLREKVILAAKNSGAIPSEANPNEIHIVWRMDHTLYNFDSNQRNIILQNIKKAIAESDDWDEFYQGIARTPDPIKGSEGPFNMELASDTDYKAIENEIYMSYVSSIMLDIPFRKHKYFSKFIVQENGDAQYLLLDRKNKDIPKPKKFSRDYMWDMGAAVSETYDVFRDGSYVLDKGTELSFIRSRRPNKNRIKEISRSLDYSHVTSCNHPKGPQSIVALGRSAEMLRCLYHVHDGSFVSFFNPDGLMIEPDTNVIRRYISETDTLREAMSKLLTSVEFHPEDMKSHFFSRNDKKEYLGPAFKTRYQDEAGKQHIM
ncbi:MAG: hypothetical protein KKF44_03185 [Nanoarchaeota archaeon]|nr:hypothetical protein [Nanoarchaeota archaeon]